MLLIIPAKPQLGEKEETREAVGAPGGDQGQAGWGPGQPELVPNLCLTALPTAGV